MEKTVKLSLLFIGLYALYSSFKYGIWVNNGPGGGFIALFIGLILIVLCGYSLLKEKSQLFKINELKKSLIPFIGIGIYILAWLVLIEKYKPIKALAIDLTICVFMYAVFSIWLKVPFPNGIIF